MLSFVRNEKRRSRPDTNDFSNKDIGTLWRYVTRTYDDNLRDRVYAYGGWESFARIDRLYVDSTDQCRYVVLLDAHDRDIVKYVRAAETLAKRHATAIVALTWFASQQEQSAEHKRRLELLRFERDFMTCCCCDDSSNDSSEHSDDSERDAFYGTTGKTTSNGANYDISVNAKRRCVRKISKTCATTTTNERRPSEVRGTDDNDDDDDDDDDEDFVKNIEDDEERCDDLDAGCLVRAVFVSSESTKRNAVRNVTLAQFFAELILYLRPFAICDRVGLIKHKAFRLIHKDAMDRCCDASENESDVHGDSECFGKK